MDTIIHKQVVLTEAAIDDFSLELQLALKKIGCKKENILKARLAVEDALFQWLERGLRNQPLEVELIKKIRHYTVVMRVTGDEINPLMIEGEDWVGADLNDYVSAVTKQISYSYSEGKNKISLRVEKRSLSHFVQTMLAIALAVMAGFAIRLLLPDHASYLATGYVDPTFETLLGILTAVVAPFIFLSLVTGIITMGDPKQLNKIGKQIMGTFLGALAVIMLVVGGIAFFTVPLSDVMLFGVTDVSLSLWGMLLKFVPTNIVTPFADKQMMQIIFLAFIFGISIVYMRETMDDVVKIILPMEKLLSSILNVICSFESILIFLGILKVMLENYGRFSQASVIIIGAHLVVFAVIFILIGVFLAFHWKENTINIMKKMVVPASVGLATASSTAAFPEVLACCEKKLGIEQQLVHFAVPFGQVIFKAGSATKLFLLTLSGMYFYEIPISGFSILVLAFLAYVLSMMVPPVSEGSVASLTILFTYMQVPVDALAIGITLSVFIDFVNTFMNLYCNQVFILVAAWHMKMVNKQVLFSRNG